MVGLRLRRLVVAAAAAALRTGPAHATSGAGDSTGRSRNTLGRAVAVACRTEFISQYSFKPTGFVIAFLSHLVGSLARLRKSGCFFPGVAFFLRFLKSLPTKFSQLQVPLSRMK